MVLEFLKPILLTFFDPVPSGSTNDWKQFFSNIKNNYGKEHEGFAYLGIGGCLFCLFL